MSSCWKLNLYKSLISVLLFSTVSAIAFSISSLGAGRFFFLVTSDSRVYFMFLLIINKNKSGISFNIFYGIFVPKITPTFFFVMKDFIIFRKLKIGYAVCKFFSRCSIINFRLKINIFTFVIDITESRRNLIIFKSNFSDS